MHFFTVTEIYTLSELKNSQISWKRWSNKHFAIWWWVLEFWRTHRYEESIQGSSNCSPPMQKEFPSLVQFPECAGAWSQHHLKQSRRQCAHSTSPHFLLYCCSCLFLQEISSVQPQLLLWIHHLLAKVFPQKAQAEVLLMHHTRWSIYLHGEGTRH